MTPLAKTMTEARLRAPAVTWRACLMSQRTFFTDRQSRKLAEMGVYWRNPRAAVQNALNEL